MGWTSKQRQRDHLESTPTVSIRVGGVERGPLPARPSCGANAVEVVFVFDTTGSMSDKIEGLVTCTEVLVADLAAIDLDWKVTAVPFGDLTVPCDTIETDRAWTSDVSTARAILRSMPRNAGGGNMGESSHEAILAALAKQSDRSALRVLVFVTDEPPLTHDVSAEQVHRAVVDGDVLVFAVTPPIESFQRLATATGGVWFPISSSVDLSTITETLRSMCRRLAVRAREVASLGGSPQAALALESGGWK